MSPPSLTSPHFRLENLSETEKEKEVPSTFP